MAASDVITFARAWAAEPRRTGAILPSGGALSRLITSGVEAAAGPVLELGAGTGAFTQALLDRGVKQERLTLIETAPAFARLLKARFPGARVLPLDAGDLARARIFQGRPLAAVISGLPLLSLAAADVERVLSGAFEYMRASASIFQFTYGPFCPVPRAVLDRLGLEAARFGWTLRNVPPASVYRIRRREP